MITGILSMTAIFGTALGPILAANTITLSLWFGRDFTKVALLTGYFLLGVGVAGFLAVPSSRIWGKRHLFLLGTVILVATSAWGGAVDRNYTSFLWARIFQGIGTAPFEALINAAVGDLYFVHQRGKRMAFTNLAVFGGAFFTPILVGKITHTLMWWWTFYLVAIFCAACLPLIFFFCPETAYVRDASLNTDMLATANPAEKEGKEMATDAEREAGGSSDRPLADVSGETAGHAAVQTPKKQQTWRQQIAIFNGRKTDESFWKLLLRPFPLFLQPAFLWASLIQGTMIGWTVFIGVIMAQFFLGYPLWWDEVKTGYAYVGAFVGAILGFLVAGTLSDWSAKKLTKWNKGVYEPEFRIVLVIPQLIFGCMGLYGWGITADGMLNKQYHYAIPLMFFAFEVAGMVIGAVASSLYIVDAYRKFMSVRCLVLIANELCYRRSGH
jgi:MFS family permease